MPSLTYDVLIPYGFDDRVRALVAAALADPAADLPPVDPYPARITRIERSACVAVGPDGDEHPLRAESLPAVGDWVIAADGAVLTVLPRWSELVRADPDGTSTQTLAADLDIVIVTAPADRISPARVERELTLAWDSGAVPLVVVTKSDLDPGGATAALTDRLAAVDVIAVSAATGAGLDELRARLRPCRTAVLLGPSGAGKSTLANALLGDGRTQLATGAVREGDHRGRHTTTSRQLVTVPGGGVLIDTPGLRSLGLHGDVSIDAGFPDVEALAAGCRFGDCAHEAEPGCAVNAAVEAGELDPGRLDNYRKLAREAAFEARRRDPLARQAQRRVWQAREAEARDRTRHRPGR